MDEKDKTERTPPAARGGGWAKVAHSLAGIARAIGPTGDGTHPACLVVARGRLLSATVRGALDAGMRVFAACTHDELAARELWGAEPVRIGESFSEALFSNAFAVLQAIEACGARAVFLGREAQGLSEVDGFLSRASVLGCRAYTPIMAGEALLGWAPCGDGSRHVPGDWVACPACGLRFDSASLISRHKTCPACGGYLRMSAAERIADTVDPGMFEEWDGGLVGGDPLSFPGYADKLRDAREKTGLNEAVITGSAVIGGMKAAVAVMEPGFMMASMGWAVGEKISRAVARATREGLPVVIFCASGGARMQEGLVSLMQMAKVSCALAAHSEAELLYIAVVTDPTTGGVTASFATQADVIVAEAGATLGFAGRRVVRDTMRCELPEGFQSAEFALEHGLVDMVCERRDLRSTLSHLLALHVVGPLPPLRGAESQQEVQTVPTAAPRGAWKTVRLARDVRRPTASAYIAGAIEDFVEIHGDRCFADDPAVVCGVGLVCGRPVTVIAQEKGSGTKERVRRGFGCAHPEGYRKALRAMRQAEKFGRPVVCIVDTQGAACDAGAEERGQGNAVAECLQALASLRVPVVSVVVGEGGSGGALALALADRVAMMENATYSILSPEGFASILWKDGSRAPEAAGAMRLTSWDVLGLGLVDSIIPEGPGAHMDAGVAVEGFKEFVERSLGELGCLDSEQLVAQRRAKFLAM